MSFSQSLHSTDPLTLEEIYSQLELMTSEQKSDDVSMSTLSILLEPITEEEEQLVKTMPIAITQLAEEEWDEIMIKNALSATSSATLNDSPLKPPIIDTKSYNEGREMSPMSAISQEIQSANLDEELSRINFDDITVQELKNVLRRLGLRCTGKKHILMNRLLAEKMRLFTPVDAMDSST